MRERDIFMEALEKSNPSERAALLDEACEGDAALRNQVEHLLAEHERQESFILDTPPAGLDATACRPLTEGPGAVIGPYKLLQQIGEGGMGVVFMAEQTEPFQRTVALKIIKPGMDTRQVVARFEAERQAVAMMDHPNIAKVLDAGATDSGRPYFVMELVKGVPITKYCDEKHLPLRARLELFIEVCQAVQHAHQKGIIHRDIKPNNVLVAEYDNHAVPKVIDFGVAKATAQKLTERTMFTEFGQVLGTVEYMSPEQSKFNQLDIDTRSDIYSLGVLLYELLAGSTPFERKRLQEAAFDEMLRIIREEEPPKPSTRLSSSAALPSIAANRGVEPLMLNRSVEGELDWIVMKALEKDRNRRYDAANGIAADVQRHLNDEAVEARPTTRVYRMRKFVRRNKAGVLAVAATVAALLIGLTSASLGFVQARRQGKMAAAQAAKATAINDLLQQMLKSGSPSASKGANYTVRQMLEDFSAGLGEEIHDQPEIEAAIRATIGGALLELDDPDAAAPHLNRALEIRRRLFGEDHQDVASSYCDSGFLALYGSQFTEAEGLLRKSLATYDKLGVENRGTICALYGLALALHQQMRYREEEAVYERAYAMARQQNAQHELADILYGQANLALATPGHAAEAEKLARQSLALHRHVHGSDHPSPAWALWTLALALAEQDKLDEAEQSLREAIAIFREQFGDAHFLVHSLRIDLRLVLMTQGDQAAIAALDAEQSANEKAALADFDKGFAIHPNRPYQMAHRGFINALQGRFDEAEADLVHAAELAPESSTATMMRALLCYTRNDDAGFSQASRALADKAAHGTDQLAVEYAAQLFVVAADSVIDAQQGLEFAERTKPGLKNGVTIGLVGEALYRAGRYEEAAQRLSATFDSESDEHDKNGVSAFGYLFLAMTHHRLGHAQEAGEWLNRAVEIIDSRRGVVAYWPYALAAQRLRHEAEVLLGVERKEATRKAGEMSDQQGPAIQSQPSTAPKISEIQPPTADH